MEEYNQEKRKYDELLIENIAGKIMKVTTEEMRTMFKEELEKVLKESKEYTDKKFSGCEACKIFEDKDNVKEFFSVTGDYKKVIMNKRDYQWVIALLATALLTVSMKLCRVF